MMPDKGHNEAIFRAIKELMRVRDSGVRSTTSDMDSIIEDLRITMIGKDGIKIESFVKELVDVGRRLATELDPNVPAFQGACRHVDSAIKDLTETLKGTWKAPTTNAGTAWQQAHLLDGHLKTLPGEYSIAIGKSCDIGLPIIYVWANYFAYDEIKEFIRGNISHWVEWRYSDAPSRALASSPGMEKL